MFVLMDSVAILAFLCVQSAAKDDVAHTIVAPRGTAAHATASDRFVTKSQADWKQADAFNSTAVSSTYHSGMVGCAVSWCFVIRMWGSVPLS